MTTNLNTSSRRGFFQAGAALAAAALPGRAADPNPGFC